MGTAAIQNAAITSDPKCNLNCPVIVARESHTPPVPQAQVCAVLFDAALVAEVEAITDPEMWPIFYALADEYDALCGGSR